MEFMITQNTWSFWKGNLLENGCFSLIFIPVTHIRQRFVFVPKAHIYLITLAPACLLGIPTWKLQNVSGRLPTHQFVAVNVMEKWYQIKANINCVWMKCICVNHNILMCSYSWMNIIAFVNNGQGQKWNFHNENRS